MLMMMELMQTDLPEPVAPAMSRCGILAMLAKHSPPEISRPSATVILLFAGPIIIKVGFDKNGIIWNTKVLSQAETPGLGAKCVEPAFSEQFKGWNPAEKKLSVKKDGGDVDAITASTITSRAYAEGLAVATNVLCAIAGTPMLLDSATGASPSPEDAPAESSEVETSK